MDRQMLNKLPEFLELIGLDEEPLGIYYTDAKPAEGLSPEPAGLPTREKEMKNEIDWQTTFGRFSCVMGAYQAGADKKDGGVFLGGAVRLPRRRFLARVHEATDGNDHSFSLHRH
ncbi:MAG: hypothetical protein ABIH66_03875, partial [bacterium]